MNWLDQLQAFKESNPDLPEGTDLPEPEASPQMRQPRLDISIERKGRAGKTATLITGWVLPDSDVLAVAAALKQKLGAGGSARGGDILLQGDRRSQVLAILDEMGYKARIV